MPNLFGRPVKVQSDIDEELLQKIANMTEGRYFRATDEKALENIYRSIDELEKTEDQSPGYLIHTPLFRYPLGAVMAFVLLLAMLPVFRSVRHGI